MRLNVENPSRLALDCLLARSILVLLFFLLLSSSFSIYIRNDLGIDAGRYLDEIVFAGFVPLVLLAILIYRKLYISSVIPGLLLFVVIALFASFYNQVPPNILLLGLLQSVKPLLILIIFQMVPLRKSSSDLLLNGLNYLFVFMTIFSFMYMVLFEIILNSNPMPVIDASLPFRFGFEAKRSFFPHPNTFAVIMVIATFFHFSQLLLTGSKKRLIILMLGLISIALTTRMKPLFMMPPSLVIVYFLFRYQRGKIKKLHLVVGATMTFIFVIAIATTALLSPLMEILEDRFSPDTNSVRISLFKGAIEILEETSGIGAGLGMYGSPLSAFTHYSPRYYQLGIDQLPGATPDNPSYITDQWWSWYIGETGVLGMAVFTGTLIFVIIKLFGFALFWKRKNLLQASLAAAAMTSIIYGILIGLAGNFLAGPPTSYYTMALAGLTFAIHRGLRRQNN